MKKLFLIMTALLGALTANAQQEEFFKPYKNTNLRLPAVPIIVNDPYFSIWSAYDKLTDGPVNYWYSRQYEKPIDGLLRVDGTVYRFMGTQRQYILGNALLKMADEEEWTAPVSYDKQNGTGWTAENFDDSSWEVQTGAFGAAGEYPNVRTKWTGENTDIYVRRTLTLTAEDLEKDLYAVYSHDDIFEMYLNGHKIVGTGETWLQGETHQITAEEKSYLHVGDNIIAAHCHNTTGGSYIDFGIFENTFVPAEGILTATQKSVDVLATNTYYTMECGPVALDLVFTAPMLIDDYDLLSMPINYISYQVRSLDGNEHDVQFYLGYSPMITVFRTNQSVRAYARERNGLKYVYVGSESQGFHETGSWDPIDWGYLYVPSINGEARLCNTPGLEQHFADNGTLPNGLTRHNAKSANEFPTLAFVNDLGKVTQKADFAMVGYDEVNDIQFFGKKYKAYWARNNKSILTAFSELEEGYESIMKRCRDLDRRIYDDANKAAGSTKYAELLSASYRHCIAAHKLFEDKDGDLLFLSRENDSGGFINTVDLTYPESPLFLLYNPDLQKAMMTSIFKYCQSDRWGFNFCVHDLGHYPIAERQHYAISFPNSQGGFEGNMPLEESGNMLTLLATISMRDGNTQYADRFWTTATIWANYLAENGQDPENQLCTDDFAGHLAHNANLSLKAIYGVAGYALMCKMKGDQANYEKYYNKAYEMSQQWKQDALASDKRHYKLTLDDRNDSWSQKYNLVWDKLWNLNWLTDVINTEITYYRGKQNTYGLPLDSRSDYTKSDWIMWTAAMSPTNTLFNTFADRVYKYVNETSSRVPISDWYWTTNARMQGFRARSVVGGHWMKALVENFDPETPLDDVKGIAADTDSEEVSAHYTISGQRIDTPQKGINIIRTKNGEVRKVIVK